ncbi:MAG: hypothetical protein ACRCXY_07620 [Fusobacteriaceae bacterium]
MNFIKNMQILILIFILNNFLVFGKDTPIHEKLNLILNNEKQIKGTLSYNKVGKNYDVIFAKDGVDEVFLTKYSLKREIKSVFLYDINGDETKEVFIISKENEKNYLEGFCLILDSGMEELYSIKTFDEKTSKEINKKISEIKNFNASLAKDELKKYYPYYKIVWSDVDYWNVKKRVGEEEYYSKGFYFQYELRLEDYKDFSLKRKLKDLKIEPEKADFIGFINNEGYLMKDSLVGACLKKYGDYYLIFYLDPMGIEMQLLEMFQGKIEDGRVIREGKYYSEQENGMYNNNFKEGQWKSFQWSESFKRYFPVSRYYKNGVLEQEDGYYRHKDVLYKKWSKYYGEQSKVIKKVYYEKNGDVSQIRNYSDGILKTAINLAHFKREYSIYDKKIGANGYEYYENRKGLSKFKSLNLENMKLENNELNLYSIKDENGKNIFIRFENYQEKNMQSNTLTSLDAVKKDLGIKEIFYGYSKERVINSLEDIVKDGYYELFSFGTFMDNGDDFEINDDFRVGEYVISSGNFKDGKKIGEWKNFDPHRGDLLEILTYEDGVLKGPYELYDVDEALREKGKYLNGEKVIEWKAPPFYQFSM